MFLRNPDLPFVHGMSGGITARELIQVLNHELSLSGKGGNMGYSNNQSRSQPPSSSQPSSSSSVAAATTTVPPSHHHNENNRPASHLVLILRSPMDLMLPSHAWKKPGKKIIKKRPKKMSLDELMRYESDEDEHEDEKEKDAFGSLYSMTQSFLTTGALGKVSAIPVAPVVPPPGRFIL